MSGTPTQRWQRPVLPVVAPDRSAGGVFRSAEKQRKGQTFGGVPLQTVTDAVVATVELGYKVADRQVDRGRRLTRQLRASAKRAGLDESEALDATERLVMKALLLGLDWVEGAAAGPDHPVRRLLAAEYRLLGSLFGLEPKKPPAAAPPPVAEPAAAAVAAVRAAAAAAAGAFGTSPPVQAEAAPALAVRHAPGTARRHVRPTGYTRPAATDSDSSYDITFYPKAAPAGTPSKGRRIGATLHCTDGSHVLLVQTNTDQPAGPWEGAICDADGLQLGSIRIEL